jgi:hypothetical protein
LSRSLFSDKKSFALIASRTSLERKRPKVNEGRNNEKKNRLESFTVVLVAHEMILSCDLLQHAVL